MEKLFQEALNQTNKGMNWFEWYIKLLFFVGVFCIIYSSFSLFDIFIYQIKYYGTTQLFGDIYFAFLFMGLALLCFYTRKELLRFSYVGYKINYLLIFSMPYIVYYFKFGYDYIDIKLFIFNTVLSLIHVIYFKKRAHLFKDSQWKKHKEDKVV